MKIVMKNVHPMLSEINSMLVDLPVSSSINYYWNWGSMLGLIFFIQVFTGLLLSSHYCSEINSVFDCLIFIIKDVENGWIIRNIHMNGASMFFIFIYIHVGRGLIFSSFKSKFVWISGSVIIFMLMGIAFLGYVLPWGQMSFWGATVITNLVSAFPMIGKAMVEWLWGGFSLGKSTLTRFFMLHFFLPFFLLFLILIHLISIHIYGSNNPLGMNSNYDKINFYFYFVVKDFLSMMLFSLFFLFMINIFPEYLVDPENYNPANPLITPIHIQPEWYFLFAYAILRSIPNKLGGVVALVMSILIILLLSFKQKIFLSMKFDFFKKFLVWFYFSCFFVLTMIGSNPVENPFEMIGQIYSMMYFIFLLML